MSHDTHHDQEKEKKVSIVSFKNSFWLVIIIVGLFVAALNFIKAESGGEEGVKEKTEMKGADAVGEKTEMKAEEPKQTEAAAKDTAVAGSVK